MTAELRKLFDSLQNKKFAPFYLIDGEEPFYIDRVTNYFEEKILAPAERDFNLLTIYGKDAEWADVVNACRRFPMFAERQVVILKDAAQMRTLNELVPYLEHPSPTTVFLIEHRFRKADGRGRLVKVAREKGVYFTSDRLKDDQVPGWIQNYGIEADFRVGEREAQILATYLGSDLQKIVNEIEKVRINVPGEKALTSEMIQKYIGISREYNLFEFPETLTNGNIDKFYRMLSFFTTHPKSAPMPMVIGSFYSHFNRLYLAHFALGKSDKEAAAIIGAYPSRVKDYLNAARHWPLPAVERCLLLLGSYSAKGVGINSNADDSELLKEMIGKMQQALMPAGNAR